MSALVKAAQHAFEDEQFEFAIWLNESAYLMENSSGDLLSAQSMNRRLHESASPAKLVNSARDMLKRACRLLDYSEALSPEEWLLIISELSGAYAIDCFLIRNGLHNPLTLEAVMAKLSEATNGYSFDPFVKELCNARRRNPNPLPEPL